MRIIEIKTKGANSLIYIGEDMRNVSNYLPPGKTVIICDENIYKLYGQYFQQFPVIIIGLGEKNKSIDTLSLIFRKLLEYEADRSTFILGIGGGIVCDVAGFAASVYMRGLKFGFVSTTLLSQVDASVGGKNGVNFMGYKNMLGVFNQPEFVICDSKMLETLDKRELRAGIAEIIKAAAIFDSSLFSYLEKNYREIELLNPGIIEYLVYKSVSIKASVVAQDEREHGERRKLNFGHTFAHTLENITGMLHGEAVSIGMVLASKLSAKLGFLTKENVSRISCLLEKTGLPVETDIKPEDMLDTMKKDKKREGNSVHLVLLDKIGHAISHKIEYQHLKQLLNDLY